MINIPTIAQLKSDILADLQAEYGGSIPAFGKNFLRVWATVQAAKLKLYYLAIANIQKNIFVDTADREIFGGTLERFGRIKLGRNPFPATAGQYSVRVTGTVGSTIQASTTFKSDDNSANPGKVFILDNAYTLVANPDTITLRALEGGTGSKLAINDTLSSVGPILGVDSTATVLSETVAPLDEEDIEDYRAKALEAYRLEPQGGATADFRLWAADANGVKQTYPYAKTGSPGEINLFVEATTAASTDGKGTPSNALLNDVESVVELDPDTTKPISERGRRPLGVFQVHYLAVTIKEIDIVISGFAGITGAIQTANFNELKSELDKIRPFVAGADLLTDLNDRISVNKIISVLLTVTPGAVFGSVTLKVNGTPMSSYQFVDGNIPHLNTVTYI